jgi:EAL domain-containing protein (putative c-di-GMP-specific phosphodiesterase class I)
LVGTWTTPAPQRRRLVPAVMVLALLEVAAFTASTLPGVRSHAGFDVLLDGWLQGTAYVVVAVLLVLRPVLCRFDRLVWSLVAAGLVARALAFAWFLSVVRNQRPVPYPSLSDAGWLAMCVLVGAALVLFASSRFRRVSPTLALDGAVAAAATAGVALAALSTTLTSLTAEGTPHGAVVVNVLYPSSDVLLLIITLGLLLAYRWTPPPAIWLFGLGVAGFAVLDSVYLYKSTHGTWHPGSPLAALSLVSTAVIAFAGWAPPGRPQGSRDHLPGVLVPGLLAGACVALLVWAGSHEVPVVAVVLGAVGVTAAVARMGLSYRDVVAALHRSDRVQDPGGLVAELRPAIARGELLLHYQPQVSLLDGRVVGVEALVRWQHPSRGLLAPADFLGPVERAGLTRYVTRAVLEQALAQVASWRDAGIETVVSVNLSANDLLDEAFPDRVDDLLDRHGVPGASVVLELTEDLLLADPVRGRAVITALLERDVKVQVDDYGTGYSTMGYLRDLPELGGLKLDRSFVTELDTDHRAAAIVASTIRLARSLGVEVIAEGVETVGVRDRLAALGCELAQGYLFARPSPADAVSFAPVETARPD